MRWEAVSGASGESSLVQQPFSRHASTTELISSVSHRSRHDKVKGRTLLLYGVLNRLSLSLCALFERLKVLYSWYAFITRSVSAQFGEVFCSYFFNIVPMMERFREDGIR